MDWPRYGRCFRITEQIQSDLHNEITQVQDDLESKLNHNITQLHTELTQVHSDLDQNITQLHNEVAQVQSDLDQTETELNHNITQLHTEITQVHSDLDHNITRLHSEITQVQDDLDQTESELNQNITRLESTIAELLHLLPANSCKQLAERRPGLPSGYYSIYLNGTALPMYCDMDRQGCNSIGGWTRVAYLNMTDPTHQCPRAWREITSPIRTCGRGADTQDFESVIFSTNGIQYSNVLGRIRGYQFGEPEGFPGSASIDGHYLDGVSITHGTPRNHIWSFAAETHDNSHCPCVTFRTSPYFVGEDYFCESATVGGAQVVFYPNDPLWDGQGCGTSTCCTFSNPPWFCKQLPQATTDDIEIRICGTYRWIGYKWRHTHWTHGNIRNTSLSQWTHWRQQRHSNWTNWDIHSVTCN